MAALKAIPQNQFLIVRFEVFMAMSMKKVVFRDLVPCSYD
jgi:hypothetical protein